jgi:hypothetical protein
LIARFYVPKPTEDEPAADQSTSASAWFLEKVVVSQLVTRSKR